MPDEYSYDRNDYPWPDVAKEEAIAAEPRARFCPDHTDTHWVFKVVARDLPEPEGS